jgi:hypothetical protein
MVPVQRKLEEKTRDPGTPASAGVAGYEIISTHETLPLNGSIEVTATCPTGKRVIGGGYVAPTVLDAASSSRPEGDKAWRVEFKSNGGNGDASCMPFAPRPARGRAYRLG